MNSGGTTILVVDDNDDNRFTLTTRLTLDGYESVVEAVDGNEALEALHRGGIDLVLLDVMMPGMSGYEVLDHIKSDMALRSIPVIMISALDEIDSVVKCIELGAEDYLPKPFNSTLLKARIGACLEKKRLRNQEESYLKRLEHEQKRADDLLQALLPLAAVHELKATKTVQPRRHEDVAVLFCDIVGFTAYCDRTPPEKVVSELRNVVSRFEEIAFEHGLEKIKTIGDAFLATAGLLEKLPDPVLASVRCGLAMTAAARNIEPGWQVRVGIQCGPVVAGIVGERQFMFDIWGDTVNVAARIVEIASPGTVLLSSEAWLHVRNDAEGRSLGFVPLKGKGEIELVECRLVR